MSTSQSRSQRILLVEDEAIIALSEQKTIEKHGFEVVTAHSGQDAVDIAIEDSSIELVLMDIDLGQGMDGTEAAERILAARRVPIVFLTAHTEKEYVDRVKSITSYGYVLKSSGEFVLIESIEMALKLFEAHQTTARQEERFSYLFNEAPIGIFQTASTGEFRYMNRELARMLQFESPEEAVAYYTDIGKQIYVSAERRREFLDQLARDGVVRDFSLEIYRSNGERAYFSVSARHAGTESGVMLIHGFIVDETEQRRAEEQLEEAHETYRLVATLAQELVVQHDTAGRWTYVNDEACRFFGKTREELLGEQFIRYVHEEDRPDTHASLKGLVESREPVTGHVNRQWTPRGWRSVQWNSSPILDREGNLRGHQAIGRDITEQRELRRQLEQERNKWWSLFHQATIGIIFSDRRHRVVEANPFAARILGYSVEELRGLRAQDLLHPEDFAAYTPEHSIAALREHGGPTQIERRYRRKDGSYMLVLVNVAELHGVEDDVFFLIMFHDITERKEAEEELRRAAQEKEHLMRELNHRVKNNLLMVSSLVSLKDAALGSAVDLSDVSNQIRAIQIVHQKLQKAADITEIELRDYVHELLEGVFASFAQKRVHIDNRLPEMTVGTRLAVPLGLIINELATNAIKHGFTGAEEPLFSVEMAHDPETGRWVLTASNTGAPFPPSVDIDAPQTLGLQLLTALVSQLHASLDVQREPHPLFTIRIPESVV